MSELLKPEHTIDMVHLSIFIFKTGIKNENSIIQLSIKYQPCYIIQYNYIKIYHYNKSVLTLENIMNTVKHP